MLHRTLIATARQQEKAEEEEGILRHTICAEGVLKKVTASTTPGFWNGGSR